MKTDRGIAAQIAALRIKRAERATRKTTVNVAKKPTIPATTVPVNPEGETAMKKKSKTATRARKVAKPKKRAPAAKAKRSAAAKAPAATDKPAPAGNASTARPDGLRVGSKQALLLDAAVKGATEKELCAELGWKKCRVTLTRVCAKVGAKLEKTKDADGATVFTAVLKAA